MPVTSTRGAGAASRQLRVVARAVATAEACHGVGTVTHGPRRPAAVLGGPGAWAVGSSSPPGHPQVVGSVSADGEVAQLVRAHGQRADVREEVERRGRGVAVVVAATGADEGDARAEQVVQAAVLGRGTVVGDLEDVHGSEAAGDQLPAQPGLGRGLDVAGSQQGAARHLDQHHDAGVVGFGARRPGLRPQDGPGDVTGHSPVAGPGSMGGDSVIGQRGAHPSRRARRLVDR
ncbi:hypothetical protein GCM10027194_07010 [Thalassiella azotivora]